VRAQLDLVAAAHRVLDDDRIVKASESEKRFRSAVVAARSGTKSVGTNLPRPTAATGS